METVIYTLIGLSLIGLVLAIITPQVNEFKDKLVVEQTINSLNVFDSKIRELLSAPGNVRVIEFKMNRGDLHFNTETDEITYVLDDSRAVFSEPDVVISIGRIDVLTTKNTGGKKYTINLTLSYPHDILFDNQTTGTYSFSAASIPYKFAIENKGLNLGNVTINIREIS